MYSPGLVLGYCCIKKYEKFMKKISKKTKVKNKLSDIYDRR